MNDRSHREGERFREAALLLVIAVLALAPRRARREPGKSRTPNPSPGPRFWGWFYAVFGAVFGALISFVIVLVLFGPAEDERTIAFQELTSLQRYLDVDTCSRPSDIAELSRAVKLYNEAQMAYRNSDFPQARNLVAMAQTLSVSACEPPPGNPAFTAKMDPCGIPPPGSSEICATGELDPYWGIAPLGDWDQSFLAEIEEIFDSG